MSHKLTILILINIALAAVCLLLAVIVGDKFLIGFLIVIIILMLHLVRTRGVFIAPDREKSE